MVKLKTILQTNPALVVSLSLVGSVGCASLVEFDGAVAHPKEVRLVLLEPGTDVIEATAKQLEGCLVGAN